MSDDRPKRENMFIDEAAISNIRSHCGSASGEFAGIERGEILDDIGI